MDAKRYTTKDDAILREFPADVIEPDFNVDAIFAETFEYRVDKDADGSELINTAGFEQVVDMERFWAIVKKYVRDRTPQVFEVRQDPFAAIRDESDLVEVTRTREEGPRHTVIDGWAMNLTELLALYRAIGDYIVMVDALTHVQVPDAATLVIRP